MRKRKPRFREIALSALIFAPMLAGCGPIGESATQAGARLQAGPDTLPEPLRREFIARHSADYDQRGRGWGAEIKFIDAVSVEYSMYRALEGDGIDRTMARETLNAGMRLLDPVWGGVYRHSTGGWDAPNFEKTLEAQADSLRLYALGYALWKNPPYLKAAEEIRRYLAAFLQSPEGAFYSGQAGAGPAYFALDDESRRKRGVPAVDRSVNPAGNGRVIRALAALYATTGNESHLADAERAASWIHDNRRLFGGGFSRPAQDGGEPLLDDTLSMARAFLALYSVTGDRAWLQKAEDAAGFIDKKFRIEKGASGYSERAFSRWKPGEAEPVARGGENVEAALLANSLFHYTGREKYHRMARHAMRRLTVPDAARGAPAAGPLLADWVMTRDPAHITVVGPKSDPRSRALFRAALKYPVLYRRLEWYDPSEGKLPNPDVRYPELAVPAAFFCADGRCSAPIFEPAKIIGQAVRYSREGD